ncbi:MAG: tRNA threonylcarbamoyladenosine dehydratase [Bacilli bacterium]|nr:tRNA threonylcarbamoyladenosine dehydratase [Bacilli bacterium]
MFERMIRIIGEEKFQLIQRKKVLLIGVGGVGGYALEALVRSGIQNITIADFDFIEETNINRQIIANSSNIGKSKVEEAKSRVSMINPQCKLDIITEKIKREDVSELVQGYDYVVDACDDVLLKVSLIQVCFQKQIKIISCMGTGNRFHPEELAISTLRKTMQDPLAKKIRSLVRKEMEVALDVPVVWSKEQPVSSPLLGTFCPVPMSAGSLLASFVIQSMINQVK